MASLYKRGKTYWVCYRQDNKTVSESLATGDLSTAKYKLNKLELRLAEGTHPNLGNKVPIVTLVKDYLDTKTNPTHAYNEEIRLRQFLDFACVTYTNQIKPSTIEKYLTYRRKQGRINWTLKHDYMTINAFLNWCIRNEYLLNNPCKKVTPPPVKTTTPRYLNQKEVQKLMKYAEGELQLMIALAVYTGIRRKEMLSLQWEDINLDKPSLIVRNAKSGKDRTIPLPPDVVPLLKDSQKDSGLLFPGRNNIPTRAYARLIKKAEIELPRLNRWHILRHTYASHLVMSGVPIATVGKLLGHSDIRTTQIYAHLNDEHLEQAIRQFAY